MINFLKGEKIRKALNLILLLLTGVILISCNKPHVYSYSEIKVDATCLEKGYIEYKCECGESFKDNYTDEKGHLFGDWITIKEASINEEGLKECVCECGETLYGYVPFPYPDDMLKEDTFVTV